MPAAYTLFDPYALIEQAKVAKPSATVDFQLDSKKRLPPR